MGSELESASKFLKLDPSFQIKRTKFLNKLILWCGLWKSWSYRIESPSLQHKRKRANSSKAPPCWKLQHSFVIWTYWKLYFRHKEQNFLLRELSRKNFPQTASLEHIFYFHNFWWSDSDPASIKWRYSYSQTSGTHKAHNIFRIYNCVWWLASHFPS